MEAFLTRQKTSDQGTFGVLEIGDRHWFTLELPWRDNHRSVSCIPVGDYDCRWVVSKKYGHVYWLEDVPGRTGILVHSGNLAGDLSAGWLSHSKGCILLGNKLGHLGKQQAILCSRFAMTDFHRATKGEDFTLTIWEVF